MSVIVLRNVKGAPLSITEVDNNFNNLNMDKLERVILASDANPAVKITQTGTGAALYVEDEANDTSPTLIDSNGNVAVGKTAATEKVDINGSIRVDGDIKSGLATINLLAAVTTVNAFLGATSLNLGGGTGSTTTNIQTGATTNGNTKTVNVATGGGVGSTTNVNVGSAAGGSTTLNSPINNYSGEVLTTSTSALQVPVGTTAQRPTGANGKIRYNTTLGSYEAFDVTKGTWGAIGGGGGATGGGSNAAFWENDTIISQNYTITAGKNAGTFGPVTVADGVTVTVPDGSTWTIV